LGPGDAVVLSDVFEDWILGRTFVSFNIGFFTIAGVLTRIAPDKEANFWGGNCRRIEFVAL
jgi:hypothetical protein